MQHHGDLQTFLEKRRPDGAKREVLFSLVQDVAKGMAWLAFAGLVHRNLKLQV